MQFLFSTIGKKIQVAVSGIFLCMFLLFHLANNFVLFAGTDTFNQMVGFLESIKPLVRVMEFGLLLILIIHTGNALKLTFENKKLKDVGYHSKAGSETSTIQSRTMAVSGSIILLFIVVHLVYIWGTYQTHSFFTDETYYDVILRNTFGFLNHRLTAIFYIISFICLSFHLRHGFQSAIKTLGIKTSKSKILSFVGFLFWGLIPLGFMIIVIAIQAGKIS